MEDVCQCVEIERRAGSMNILILNHYAGSPEMGMEFRPYYFAREWIKMGHRVDIMAADYSHLRRVNPEVDHDFQEQVVDGIHYHWIQTGTYEGNGAKRAMTMFRFVSKLWLNAKKIINELSPDVVIASSTYPLDTYVGQRIRKLSKKKVKLIHEVHDMWPASPIEIGGMSPEHPFIKVMQRGEDSFCRNSDVVVSLLPAAKEYFVEHGMRPEKFQVVMNGVVLEDWENPTPLPEELVEHFENLRKRDILNIVFCGSIHKTYGLEHLIEAVKQIEGVFATFIGPGLDKQELMEKTKSLRDKVEFFDPIPKQSIPTLFQYADVSYVACLPYKLNRFGICMNKLFDSMMGAKPILYSVDAPNNYIIEYECGISVEAGNVADLVTAVERFKNMNPEQRQEMGSRGKSAALNKFNYTFLAKDFMDIMQVE